MAPDYQGPAALYDSMARPALNAMKAVVLEQPGSPAGLRLQEVETPRPGPREALVKVAAAGVCHHDVAVMRGQLRRGVKERLVLGHEIAGVVVEAGNEVSDFAPGDRVASILTNCCGECARCLAGREHRCLRGHGIGHGVDGGYAEFVAVAAASLARVPDSVPLEQAAIAACPIGVVLRAVRDLAQPRPEETAVVTGAGGGVGIHGVGILKAKGARVLAVTTSPAKEAALVEAGADHVIVSPDLDFHWEVLALTDDAGADVVLDSLGSRAFDAAFQSLGQYGRFVFIGEMGGGEVSLNPAELLFKDARLMGMTGANKADLIEALAMIESGAVRPVVTPFPLADAARVHQMLLDRAVTGRAVLVP